MYSQTLRNFDDIQLKHLGRVFGRMVRIRLRAVAGVSLVATVAVLLDPVPWRIAWLGLLVVSAAGFFVYEERRYRREGFTARSVPLNAWVGLLVQQCFVLGTGGISSPLLPSIFPFAFVGSVVSRPHQRGWLLLAMLGALTAMSVAQLSGWLPGLVLRRGSAPLAGLGRRVVVRVLGRVGVDPLAVSYRNLFPRWQS